MKTLKLCIKDKHIKELNQLSGSVNFVWNYVNALCFEHLKRTGKFFSAYLGQPLPGIAVIAFACIVGGVVSVFGNKLFESAFIAFVTIAIHNFSGTIAGIDKDKKRTLAIEVGVQNAGLATGLSTKFFPSSAEAAVVAAVATIWHSVSGSILVNMFSWSDKQEILPNPSQVTKIK